MILSQETTNVLTERFVTKPFSVPSPGCGMEMLRHAGAMTDLARELVESNPAAAIEVQMYARQIHELAGQFAVLQLLPIEMLRHYVEGTRAANG